MGFKIRELRKGIDFDIYEDEVVPYHHCTNCGLEMDYDEDSPVPFVCGQCWKYEIKEGMYNHLRKIGGKDEKESGEVE